MGGAMAVTKGKITERAIARYLTTNGMPARRHVQTGDAAHFDEGDLRGDGWTIEAKNWSGDLTIGSVETLLAKLAHQKRLDDLGLLVDRLDRVADPGKWRVWMTANDALWLLTGRDWVARDAIDVGQEPVSMRLAYVVERLRVGGWFTPVNPFG